MRARRPVPFLALYLLLAGCTGGGPRATLEIAGDTLVRMATFVLPGGERNADCGYRFTARVAGDTGTFATIRQGRISYSLAETEAPHASWEWTPERLPSIWPDPVIAAGDTAVSQHHHIAFSLPFQPMRAEVVFDYTVDGDDAVRATEPFVFTCR